MWTEERTAELKGLIGRGYTIDNLAEHFQTTRGAISGKLFRLKGELPARSNKAWIRVSVKKTKPKQEQKETPVPKDAPRPVRGVNILTVKEGQCKFPLWPSGKSTHLAPMCGHPVATKTSMAALGQRYHARLSYCPYHYKLSLRPEAGGPKPERKKATKPTNYSIRKTVGTIASVEVFPTGRRGRYGMTPEQQKAYLKIIRHFDEFGVMPVLEEIDENRGVAHELLAQLDERGWVEIHRDETGTMRPRGFSFTEPVMRHLKPVN